MRIQLKLHLVLLNFDGIKKNTCKELELPLLKSILFLLYLYCDFYSVGAQRGLALLAA